MLNLSDLGRFVPLSRSMKFSCLFIVCLFSPFAQASAIYNPPGANLTLGSTNHNNGFSVLANNPAATAIVPSDQRSRGVGVNIGGGLEYGNVDEIFAIIDTLSEMLAGDGGDLPETPPPQLPDEPVQLPTDLTWQDILDNNPEFNAWFEAVQDQATFFASSFAIISQQAYAKAFVTADVPFLISNDIWGGSLSATYSSEGTSKALGIVDLFNFDADYALSQIDEARNLDPSAPETSFDLSDDIVLIVNPGEESVQLKFNNDSLLLTKAVITQNININYSREAYSGENGTLLWGLRPKLYRVGLTQVDTRFGELTDAESLFNDIRNADFHYANRVSLDLGVLWASQHYRLGATLLDPFSPEFSFPDFDPSRYSKSEVLTQLRQEMRYELKPQLRMEGSLFSRNKRWSTHLQLDANAATDPMSDKYQWLVVSTAYRNSNNWVPDLRFSYRKNLSGSNLGYFSSGITLFKIFNLDISRTAEMATISGDSLPRGLNLSLGLNFSF
ncbi:plasmid transfer operon, TraF, protein [Alteromonadaceae bacterium Bs31]|nr:plasmid transfer operon, TraF, protein [Alteromonadaceae bacterium Bs31]